jgi:hypothetical protein
MKICIITGVTILCLMSFTQAEGPYQVGWTAQIGTGEHDVSYSTAADGFGNVYITGYTYGDLATANAGLSDAFLAKFDSSGNELWRRQIGTSDHDPSNALAVDAFGNAYITGNTYADLGGTSAGGIDAFLVKFDASGNQVWATQMGTGVNDRSRSVAVDASGNIYMTGHTVGSLGGTNEGGWDTYLSKFDVSGSEVWTQQIGTSGNDFSESVALDALGNIYITGKTSGDLGGINAGLFDAYVSKFDASGSEVWTTQIGSIGEDESWSVAVDDDGNVYLSGMTRGDLGSVNAGSDDAFLCKLDASGNESWIVQIGTEWNEFGRSIAIDANEDVFLSGYTGGDLGGTSAGNRDAFLGKFDALGNEIWMTQIGTGDLDESWSVAMDTLGNAYITGHTYGDLNELSGGGVDAFLCSTSA